MRPYRTIKPHAGTDCRQCAPTGQGHHQCQNDGCDEIAARQTLRHATEAEYAALAEALQPIDGVATRPVFGCDDCTEDGQFDPFCTHTVPEPGPCPKCQAAGEAPCTGRNGGSRRDPHRVRADAEALRLAPEPCHHAHRPDCGIFTDCQCAGDDPNPVRPRRLVGESHAPDVSGLTVPVFAAQTALARAGHSWDRTVRVWSLLTQDNQPALGAEVRQYDGAGNLRYDVHGHPVVETVTLRLPQAVGQGPKALL